MKQPAEKDRQMIDDLLRMMTAEELATVRKFIAAMIRQRRERKRSG